MKPYVIWRDGVLVAIRSSEAERLRSLKGKEVRVVWSREADLLSYANNLTAAQLNRLVESILADKDPLVYRCSRDGLTDVLFQLAARKICAGLLRHKGNDKISTEFENSTRQRDRGAQGSDFSRCIPS